MALAMSGFAVLAADPSPTIGQPIVSLIEQYRAEGMAIAYSSNLLTDAQLIQETPDGEDRAAILRSVLAPYSLTLLDADGLYLVVRNNEFARDSGRGSILVIIRQPAIVGDPDSVRISSRTPLPEPEVIAPGVYKYDDLEPGEYVVTISIDGYVDQRQALEVDSDNIAAFAITPISSQFAFDKVVVTTSRYELKRELSSSVFYISSGMINQIPDFGDDPIRAAQRLPGVAAGGISAKSHFRGGDKDENAIVLNGHALLDPYHIRNYQSVFSAIDPRAISDMEVYTGGFPVKYGSKMSGVTVIDTLKPEKPLQTELGLSVYNTSILSAGSYDNERGNWLLSARRGNLDLVIPDKYGDPRYSDLFVEVGYEISPTFDISINAFISTDRVLVVTESDSEDQKQLDDKAHNNQFWIRLSNEWTNQLSSSTVFSYDYFTNDRTGFYNDPEKIIGNVNDDHDFNIYSMAQDWSWLLRDDYLLQWGFTATHANSNYRYMSDVNYFGIDAAYIGVPDMMSRNIHTEPDGDNYSIYVSNRKMFFDKLIVDLGVRWDKQTYIDNADDTQTSGRVNLFYPVSDDTDLRFSWGRFYQYEAINELQVEDGVVNFFPAQKSDQAVLGFQHRIGRDYLFRTELFYKDMKRLKPRYENLFDSLALIPEIEPDRVEIAPDGAIAKGIEVLIEYDGPNDWSWWGSYAWSNVSDNINGGTQLRNWNQQNSVQAGFSWTPGNWTVDLAAKVHSGWPTTDLVLVNQPNGEYYVFPGPRNAHEYNLFATVDFRVSRRFAIGSGTLTGFFELTNAFNRENECCTDYDVDFDDNDVAFLDISEDHWLPLLPAVGVLYQF